MESCSFRWYSGSAIERPNQLAGIAAATSGIAFRKAISVSKSSRMFGLLSIESRTERMPNSDPAPLRASQIKTRYACPVTSFCRSSKLLPQAAMPYDQLSPDSRITYARSDIPVQSRLTSPLASVRSLSVAFSTISTNRLGSESLEIFSKSSRGSPSSQGLPVEPSTSLRARSMPKACSS